MSNITIALADDHAILRKGLISILNSYDNIEVIADADNGKELIDKLGTLNKLPDIAILDINMPVMDGYAATRHISSHWKTVKILALSMYDDEECVIKMLRCGANGYVLKDINPDMLRDALAHLKTNQYYYSDLVTGRLLSFAHTTEMKKEITDREREFLELCCTEMSYKEISEQMHVSPRTVDGYRESLFAKLNINSRIGLAMYAIRTGLVKI